MEPEHASSVGLYAGVLASLLLLTVATVGISGVDLGAFNTAVALAIAAAKAFLVAAYFMHLRREAPVVRIVAGAGFLWLIILIVLTFNDYLARR